MELDVPTDAAMVQILSRSIEKKRKLREKAGFSVY